MKQLVLEHYLEVSGCARVTEERYCFKCGASGRNMALLRKVICSRQNQSKSRFQSFTIDDYILFFEAFLQICLYLLGLMRIRSAATAV